MTPTFSRRDFLKLGALAAAPLALPRLIRPGSRPMDSFEWYDMFAVPDLHIVWEWVREDPTHWSLTERPDWLRITTQTGGIFGPGGDQRNILLTSSSTRPNWQITTRVQIEPTHNFQHAALIVYQDDDNYVQINRAFAHGQTINFDLEVGGVATNLQVPETATSLYLRITKVGSTYTGSYSLDRVDWVIVGHHRADFVDPRVGLAASNSPFDAPEIPADFAYFHFKSIDHQVFMPAVLSDYRPHDVIFVNGSVVTMDDALPEAEALAMRDDRIVAVGSEADVLALRKAHTQVIDLGGLTLLPGFVDPHSHLLRYYDPLDLETSQQSALQVGITTLAEAAADGDLLGHMHALEQAGNLRVRASLYLVHINNCGESWGDWYTLHSPTRGWGEMLRIGGVKVFTDGGSCGAPAVSFDHPAYGFGDLWFTQQELNGILQDVHDAGYQLAIHALGDRAVDQVLNSLEHILNGAANTPRHRIEHNGMVRDDLLPRYAQVNPVALIFGSMGCPPSAQPLPEEYRHWEWRWPDLLAAHPEGHFAWHSDRGAWLFPLSPLNHLYSMVSQWEVDADDVTTCNTPDWLSHKTLAVAQALPLMNIDAAYALDRDSELGSLVPGKLADLVILSDNPTAVDLSLINDIVVCATIVGGRTAYCAPGYEPVCPGS